MSDWLPTTARGRADRLSALDASNLRVEEHGMPMHVAALVFLDGAPLLDPSGEPMLEQLRTHVEQRLLSMPRLRQVLAPPARRTGSWRWVEDRRFDIEHHVRAAEVPEPRDEAALLRLSCELNEPALDRSRPLWEMWFLTGLTDGRVAMLVRVHHVVADGIALLGLLGTLFDVPQEQTDQAGTASTPPAGRTRPTLPRSAAVWARQLVAVVRQGRAPTLSINRPVGPRRRLHLLRADLEETRTVAHRHGGKINDVVLAAVAGGARRLLDSRGELSPGLKLTVSVAASIRRPDDPVGAGNRVGVRMVPVPLGEPDVVTRLEAIAATTAQQRRWPPYQPAGRLMQRWMVHVMTRQRMVNLLLSNVPGPPVPLSFAGAPVREMFQVGVVQGNLALSVGVLSYAGRLNVNVLADADVVPDIDVFARGISEALDELGVLVRDC